MRKGNWLLAIVGAVAAVLAGGPSARAATFDGKAPLICALVELNSCGEGRDCRPETPDSLDVPRFLRIDIQAKTIVGTRPDGGDRTTPIQYEAHQSGRMFLGGVDGPLSWHLDIAEDDGSLMLGATGTNANGAFAVTAFGDCTSP